MYTFLFTDITDSTRRWQQHPRHMAAAFAVHDTLTREHVLWNGGEIVKSTGDGFHAVFSSTSAASLAAVNLQ